MSNVINLDEWKEKRMRAIKGIVEGPTVACDRWGSIDTELPDAYNIWELADERVINGKTVAEIRKRLLAEQFRYS